MAIDSFLTNIAEGICSNLLEKSVKNLFDKKRFEEIFCEAGEFVRSFEIDEFGLREDLTFVFSDSNMKQLAKDIKNCPGYTLKDRLISQLMDSMLKRGIPYQQASLYANRFFVLVLGTVEKLRPEEYKKYFLTEWKDEQEKTFAKILSRFDDIQNLLEDYKKGGIKIDSANSLDRELHRRSKLPGLGIHSFETDDEVFREQFKENKENNIVYVRARNREEAVYSIVAELWKENDERPVFIVRNKSSWEKLRDASTLYGVYIPWFFNSEIPAIENGTNIFIYTDGLPSFSNEEIVLRPRMHNTIIESLKRAGMKDRDAAMLVKETHGLFSQIKKKTERVLRMDKPAWVEKLPDRIKKVCLLLGQWTDAEGDKAAVEQLSGMKYEEFLEKLRPHCNCEDPLIHVIGNNRNKGYYLSSVENVWGYVHVSSKEPIWDEFAHLFTEILNESEKLFTYSDEERIGAQVRGEKLFWSESIRNGMIRTMIMKACYDKEDPCQSLLDVLVANLFEHVDSEEKWRYISGFFADLCEISPKETLKRLQKELQTNTGLLGLFSKQNKNILLGSRHYISVLFGVDEFLVQKEYVNAGYEWLLKLDNLSYEYSSNRPKDSIMKVLCPWRNFSALQSYDEKRIAAEKALRIDSNAWGYLYQFISRNSYCAIGGIHSPRYRQYERETSVSGGLYNDIINAYFLLLVDHTGGDYKKWADILSVLYSFPDEQEKYAIAVFNEEIVKIRDIDKALLKRSLRQLVYKHRYFATASWAMGEETIKKYEQFLDQIKVDNPEYEYVYYFDSSKEAVFLDPVPFEEEEHREVNKERSSEIAKIKVSEFFTKKYNILKLVEICAQIENSTLGMDLALYSDSAMFDETIFEALYHIQQSRGMALDYINGMYRRGVDVFCSVKKLRKKLDYNDEFLVGVYRIEAVFGKGVPRISTASRVIKEAFWKDVRFQKESNYKWALDECRKFGNSASYINLLYQTFRDDTYELEELYERVLALESIRRDLSFPNDGYALSQVLKPLQEKLSCDAEKSDRLAKIEVLYFRSLGWENMHCFREALRRSPDMYAEMASVIFRKEGETVPHELSEDEHLRIKVIYELFDMANFCPAERKGVVDEKELVVWVERFKELLIENKQQNLFGYLIGRLWCFSPVGGDGYNPCEAVRNVIETYGDDDMIAEYATVIYNHRGVVTVTGGKDEQVLARKYKSEANYLRLNYPKTASVFAQLSATYADEAKRERQRAENGVF